MGFTVWITGDSRGDMGESVPAALAEMAAVVGGEFERRGVLVQVLMGDVFSEATARRLGFDVEDREERARRLGEMSRLLNQRGVAVVVADDTACETVRAASRSLIEHCFQIYCAEDGADAGEEKSPPPRPAVLLRTDLLGQEACVARILAILEDRALIPAAGQSRTPESVAGKRDRASTTEKSLAC